MKQRLKLHIELLPVLGVLGLIFVALYFLILNFGEPSGKPRLENSPYALFYKLYPKLGYRFKIQYSLHLPQPRRDLLIYFDYDGNAAELATLRRQWVQPGGTLLVAGINANVDPISRCRLQTDLLHSGAVVQGSEAGVKFTPGRLNLKNQALKHLPVTYQSNRNHIILTSGRGPLAYRTKSGAGTMFVLTDSDLLKNNILRGPAAAVFVNELLRSHYRKRVYLLEPNLARRPRATPIIKFLFQNKLLLITLQLLWMGLLFLAWQGKRFGAPQPAAPYARRSLSAHLQAVGNWYHKTNALAIVDAIHCDYFQYLLRKRIGCALKAGHRATGLDQIAALLVAVDSGLGQEQLKASLTKEDPITFSRLQRKVKLQEQILKALQSNKSRK
jgi:hypothetical protein